MISCLSYRRSIRPILTLITLTALCSAAFGQIGIWVKADHKHYLRYEPVEVAVTLRNYSGNTLVFGGPRGASQGAEPTRVVFPTAEQGVGPGAGF